MARGRKKKRKAPKNFNITQSKKDKGFDYIEDIWAEHGVVRVLNRKGETSTLTPELAAVRCQAINSMKLPEWHARKRDKFIEKAISVIREAMYQKENKSSNKATEGIQNVLSGLTAEGKQIKETTDEDELVQKYMFEFPALHEHDIRAILREKRLDMPRKRQLMEAINKQNFAGMDFKPTQGPQ